MPLSRVAKEMLRLIVIGLMAFAALVALTWFAHVLLPSTIAQVVLIPFYLAWGVVVVACWGIGPLAKRLNRAALEDAKEQREVMNGKQ
jgi:cobalamin biosynthesis protein CobD/CbiB